MPEALFFRDLILAIAAALVGGAVAHRLGQPPLIGYLLGGVATGPYTPGPVSEVRHVAMLADIGVMLLMFELGVEFPLGRLRQIRALAIGGGVLQIALTAGVGALVGGALGLGPVSSVFLGVIMALSSTMVALKLLLERGEMDAPHGRVVIGLSLVQDLSLLPFLVLLPAWAISGEGAWVPLLSAAGKTLALFLGTYVTARLVVPLVFRRVSVRRTAGTCSPNCLRAGICSPACFSYPWGCWWIRCSSGGTRPPSGFFWWSSLSSRA